MHDGGHLEVCFLSDRAPLSDAITPAMIRGATRSEVTTTKGNCGRSVYRTVCTVDEEENRQQAAEDEQRRGIEAAAECEPSKPENEPETPDEDEVPPTSDEDESGSEDAIARVINHTAQISAPVTPVTRKRPRAPSVRRQRADAAAKRRRARQPSQGAPPTIVARLNFPSSDSDSDELI